MDLDQADLDRLAEARKDSSKTIVSAPSEHQKLGTTSVVCLILNRTIGEFFTTRARTARFDAEKEFVHRIWDLRRTGDNLEKYQ